MFSLINFIKDMLFFAGYVSTSAAFPDPLSKEEEEYYIDRYYNHNDQSAKSKLIEHNLRLVAHISKKYVKSGIELDELISIGSIGLVKAVSTFLPEKGNLAAYASRCIENEILMFMRKEKKRTTYELSIDTPIGHDTNGNEVTIADRLSDESENAQEETYRQMFREKMIVAADKVLDAREKRVIELRYCLNSQKTLAQREVAKELNVSRSYVSRIEKKALKKLGKFFFGNDE